MVAIIDYNAGNLTSVQRAVNYLGFQAEITADPDLIQSAEKIIFPGVGAARATMTTLRERGLDQILRQAFEVGKPMLGICIGIQILFHHSKEEDTNCLGILPGQVKQFEARAGFKVPQIGWNMVYQTRPHWIFEGVPNPAHGHTVIQNL